MLNSLKQKTVRGILWSSLERFSVQGIQFVVMIVMANMLTPHDYGLIAMLAVFIAVSQSLVDSGFSQALIRKQDRTETDNSTVFYFNIVVGLLLYALLFIAAPLIADFYNEPQLVPITRVIGLSVLINSFVVVQRALLTIKIDFKTQAKAALTAAFISGVLGIWMAATGYGVWSIVAQQLVNLGVNALLLWILSHWRPLWSYSWASFHNLFGFGSKLMVSGLIDNLYRNIYLIVIGRIFSASDLGFYTRAHQFTDFPSSNLSAIIQRVTYPVLCSIQNEDERLSLVYRKFLRLSAFVIFPLMMVLAAVSKPIVLTLLNEQWLFAATLTSIICFNMMWYPIHAINLNLLQVKGRSDLFLKLEIYKKIIGVFIICITIPFGLVAMCVGGFFTSMIGLFINTYYTGKLIGVGYFRQMADLLPIFFLSVSMGAVVFGIIHYLSFEPALQLVVGICVGIIYYVLIALLFKFNELKELIQILKRKK